VLFLLSTMIGCAEGANEGPRFSPLPSERVPLEPGYFGQVAWIDAETLAVVHFDSPNPNAGIAIIDRGGDTHQLPLPRDPSCQLQEYLDPTLLAPGRLGYVDRCVSRNDPFARDRFTFQSHDLTTERTRPLVQESIREQVMTFGWNITHAEGVAGLGDDLCATLVFLTSGSIRFPEITVGGDEGPVTIDASLIDPRRCGERPRAAWPALDPGGSMIAFFASPDSVGARGLERADVPWNLYLLRSGESEAEELLPGIRYSRSLTWSPGGDRLLFSGELAGTMATWIYDPATERVRGIAPYMDWLAWSPDGNEIAATTGPQGSDWPPDTDLHIIDVGAHY
jgi:hypothetical protein